MYKMSTTINDDEILDNLGYKPSFKGMFKYISGDGKTRETELVMERKYTDDKKSCSHCNQTLPLDSFSKVVVGRYMKRKGLYVRVFYRNCYCKSCFNEIKKGKKKKDEVDDGEE
jgi:hypothetical protein